MSKARPRTEWVDEGNDRVAIFDLDGKPGRCSSISRGLQDVTAMPKPPPIGWHLADDRRRDGDDLLRGVLERTSEGRRRAL